MELNRIYNQDCLEGMHQLAEGSVDLIVTSPPYNVGIDYGEEYDDSKDFGEYMQFIEKVMAECFRVLKDGGRAVFNVANTGRKPYRPLNAYYDMAALSAGFLMRGEVIWYKGAGAGTGCAWGSWCSPSMPSLRDEHEYLLCFSKGSYTMQKNGESTISRDEFMDATKSVWHILPASAKRIGHPVPYPEELVRRCINLFSFSDAVVLDPFMGSGTTAIVAAKLGRKFLGFELSKKFHTLANKRLRELTGPFKLYGDIGI